MDRPRLISQRHWRRGLQRSDLRGNFAPATINETTPGLWMGAPIITDQWLRCMAVAYKGTVIPCAPSIITAHRSPTALAQNVEPGMMKMLYDQAIKDFGRGSVKGFNVITVQILRELHDLMCRPIPDFRRFAELHGYLADQDREEILNVTFENSRLFPETIDRLQSIHERLLDDGSRPSQPRQSEAASANSADRSSRGGVTDGGRNREGGAGVRGGRGGAGDRGRGGVGGRGMFAGM